MTKGTTLHNIALAYVIQKAAYCLPLVGTRTLQHFNDAMEGLKVSLSDDDIEKIESSNVFDPGFPHSFFSGPQSGGDPYRSKGRPGCLTDQRYGHF